MRYTPFEKQLADILPDDLATLREVHEGWYVEYKSEVISNRALAKSLSSFANQYGGWLFLGVSEDRNTNTAQSFPGIPANEVIDARESLRNATKDLLRPEVFYEIREFAGPIPPIGLARGQSVIVVRIPEGPNPPYVHNDGRIYRRIGDSSDPKHVIDRSTFDLLYRRGEQTRSLLKRRILRSPIVSEGEENQCFVHFSILSDPYESMGHWYDKGLADFSEIMKGKSLPFDNIFSTSEGFIARQTHNNDPYNRIFTWEFSRRCHSFVTLPIPILPIDELEQGSNAYFQGDVFASGIADRGLDSVRILDLNIVLDACLMIIQRHRRLVGQANIKGPFYVKARLENVFRTIPFLDLSEYLAHIAEFDFPIIQQTDIMTPAGTTLDTFVVSPAIDELPSESEPVEYEGPVRMAMAIFHALGISGDILMGSTNELSQLGQRRLRFQRIRSS